ncbi:MAG: acyloxyacyl hydrolase [Candidatus Thiodiazotropha sp. (ex Monitilora ramsayi)]|nr:acyloxyacyl hydrolase [Candidatus Thiodiazotropha sp. (ex Monitilora ramsayi)]
MKQRVSWSIILLLTLTSRWALCDEGLPTNWQLLIGYGESHPGWGDTKERVETRDIILRHERPQDRVRGQGWYRNRRSLQIELPLHLLDQPDEPPMAGIYFNACWTFLPLQSVQPYLLAGGGPLYTNAKIPGTSSRLKGVYQAAGGLKFNLRSMNFNLEYRFHHVSNGGLNEPNDPLNSGKLFFGLQLPL